MSSMNKKPLPIRLREAKEELFENLNTILQETELPCYLIEPIISELHRQVSDAANREYEQAKAQQYESEQEMKGAFPE